MSSRFWPTKDQELLLCACLLSGNEAVTAWRQWKEIFELGSFDDASRRLLPLLYRNLKDQDIQEPSIARLKEEYLYTWSQNQFCWRGIAGLLNEFNQSGIRTMLLKGSALAILYYEDVGLRPMKDIDLMVGHDQVKRAMELLRRLGWKPRYSSPEALIPFEQATEFIDSVNTNLDLHWRLMWEARQDLNDDDFWQASIPMQFNSIQTRSLDPADLLLLVCVHGAKWNDTSPLRWIPDSMMIIRSQKLRLDWTRVVRQAQKRQLTLAMSETLSYLNKLLDARIPTEVLAELKESKTTRLQRWTYRTRLGTNDSLKMLPVVWHWFNSLRIDCEGNALQRLSQFSQYLQSLWSVNHPWKVPFYLVGKPIKRVCDSIRANLTIGSSPSGSQD